VTVAVTGLGMMSGLGLDVPSSWAGAAAGRSVTREFTLFGPDGLDCTFGVQLPDGADAIFEGRIKKRHRRQMTRGTMLALIAAEEALAGSGIDLAVADRARVGVVAGTTGTGYAFDGDASDPHRILRNMSNSPAAWLSLRNKLAGPAFTVSTACSSGVYALASAYDLLKSGASDVVLAGAADSSLNRPDVEGFEALMALAQEGPPEAASRPFDTHRSGFVMGEGGGFVVLERVESARARGAEILALLHRPALTSEAYNIISPAPGGRGMAVAMRLALDLAGLEPADIDHVNAHGTSTQRNDLLEAQAIRDVFGDHARTLPVSSTKSMTGHCLAGAAGVEAVLCCKELLEQTILPTANLTEPDPDLGLDFVPLEARPAELRHVMCNSFAFGGHNGVCILSRPD